MNEPFTFYCGSYLFNPQPDITPLESVRCSQLLSAAAASMAGQVNMRDSDVVMFIQQHQLYRHFRLVQAREEPGLWALSPEEQQIAQALQRSKPQSQSGLEGGNR